MSMNYQDCLKVLASKTRTERLNGLEIKIKPVPESDRHGIPDEREAAWMRRTQNPLHSYFLRAGDYRNTPYFNLFSG